MKTKSKSKAMQFLSDVYSVDKDTDKDTSWKLPKQTPVVQLNIGSTDDSEAMCISVDWSATMIDGGEIILNPSNGLMTKKIKAQFTDFLYRLSLLGGGKRGSSKTNKR